VKIHQETKEFPVLDLVVAKDGPKDILIIDSSEQPSEN
jgi:uncharacterized protein (TIGR03435 family)